MTYWQRLHIEGWQCPECGTTQHGEYECESDYCASVREVDAELDRKRVRRDMLAAVVAREPFLSPGERRRKIAELG